MMWQHPFALLGALAIALPIAIHLLGRGHAKVYRFPTLRFFRTSRLLPTRRTRIHDPWLLALRCAIVLAAACALAQPLLTRNDRRAEVQRRIVRAIVVDSSASMRGVKDSVSRITRQLAVEADAAMTIETTVPGAAIQAASTWLQRQPGRRELIVVSDFARGVVDRSAFAAVPLNIGVRLIRVRTSVDRSARMLTMRGDSAVVADIDLADKNLSVRWAAQRAPIASSPRILAAPQELSGGAAALRAARMVGVPASYDTSHDVAIVLPGYSEQALRSDKTPSERWMIDVLARMSVELPADQPPHAVERDSAGRHALMLFCDAPAASVRCASILSAAMKANTNAAPLSELEPERIGDAELAEWGRVAGLGTDVRRAGDWLTGPSDARWLWGLVLLLLTIETVIRRESGRSEAHVTEAAHDVAA